MRIFYLIFITVTLLLSLTACQKDIDLFVADPVTNITDTIWQNNIAANAAIVGLTNELKVQKLTDSFAYSNAAVVYSSGNISLIIPANGLTKNNGTVPVGTIKRESLLIQKKGDFIAMGIPTTINGKLMVTGGAFFLGLKNNNDNILVSQGNKITVRFNNNLPAQNNRIYNAVIDSATGFFVRWEQNNDTAFNKSFATSTGYEILTNKLQYVQTAHLLDTVGIAQTTIALKLPANYTNTNTIAYVAFNNIESVAGFTANVNARKFISPLLPVNKPVTIVIISKQGADYYLGSLQTITAFTTTANPLQELNITPVKRSLQQIKTFLDSL